MKYFKTNNLKAVIQVTFNLIICHEICWWENREENSLKQ